MPQATRAESAKNSIEKSDNVKPVITADGASVRDVKAPYTDEEFATGRVLAVGKATLNKELLQSVGMVSNREFVSVEVLEGKLKGRTVTVANEITDNPVFNINVKPGSEVILSVVTARGAGGEKNEVNIADYHRAPALGWLLLAFLVAFVVFGGKKGVKSLVALLISVCLIAFVLLPLSLNGWNPLLVAIGICLVSSLTTMYFVAGRSRKSLAAIAGTVGGVIVAGVAAQLVIVYAPLTGLSSEEAQILRGSVLVASPRFYTGLLAAGMLIGALGVIMDVGISIASAVAEVAKTGQLTFAELYESGMNVGRDIMGTMTNTLILAYTGSALPLLLLIWHIPSTKLINLDLVATEVASAISGSLGLVLTIPLTAYFAARLMASGPAVSNKSGGNTDSKKTAK